MTAPQPFRTGQIVVADDGQTFGTVRKITRVKSRVWLHLEIEGAEKLDRVRADAAMPIATAMARLFELETTRAAAMAQAPWEPRVGDVVEAIDTPKFAFGIIKEVGPSRGNGAEILVRRIGCDPLEMIFNPGHLRLVSPAEAEPVAPYWLVHGRGPASHKHFSEAAAEAEAERLAAAHPGQRFAVLGMTASFLAPIGAVQRDRPTPGVIHPDDEIPF